MPKAAWVIIIFILALGWVFYIKESRANSIDRQAVIKAPIALMCET